MQEEEHDSLQAINRNQRREGRDPNPRLFQHQMATQHSLMSRNPLYRSAFELSQRLANWFMSCIKCRDSESSYVESIDEQERMAPAKLSPEYSAFLKEKILKLKVLETSRLELKADVMHPFVRVHFVNSKTGNYLKMRGSEPVVYHQETVTIYNEATRAYESAPSDLLLPFATNCCQFRKLGNSKGLWNEVFYVNLPAQEVLTPELVVLFEVLDFSHQALLARQLEDYDKDNLHRVAWGYLRPVGIAGNHLGESKVELYRYKFNTKTGENQFKKSYVPQVYYDFIWSNHEKYEGYLSVQLNACKKPQYRFLEDQGQIETNVFEEIRGDRDYLRRFKEQDKRSDLHLREKTEKKILKFCRTSKGCELPKTLIYKMESARLGCFRVRFVGNNIYAACSSRKHTIIKVFSLQNGEHVMSLKGHREVIYSMTSTEKNQYLITAGGDDMARVWKISDEYGQSLIRGECLHTAAVYSACGLYMGLQELLKVLTCSYDGYVRLWEVVLGDGSCQIEKEFYLNNQERGKGKVYPTCCNISEGPMFIVGDSIGGIRIYDYGDNQLTQRCVIFNDILSMHMLNQNNIILMASGSILRHFQISGNKLRLRTNFSGSQCSTYLLECCVSPDCKYLLSVSENGKPYIWDVFEGKLVNTSHLNLEIKRPLSSCHWHPKYNLVCLSGFIEQCPIFVYGNVLLENEIKLISAD